MKSKLTLLFASALLFAQTSPLMAGCCFGGEDNAQEEAAPVEEIAFVEEVETVAETQEVEAPEAETAE